MMLRCEACGAFRPVTKRTSQTSQQTSTEIKEGDTLEVEITDRVRGETVRRSAELRLVD